MHLVHRAVNTCDCERYRLYVPSARDAAIASNSNVSMNCETVACVGLYIRSDNLIMHSQPEVEHFVGGHIRHRLNAISIYTGTIFYWLILGIYDRQDMYHISGSKRPNVNRLALRTFTLTVNK